MLAANCLLRLLCTKNRAPLYLNTVYCHCVEDISENPPPLGWYQRAYNSVIKLSRKLKNIDQVDGKLINIDDDSVVRDDTVEKKMQKFKLLTKELVGSPFMQQSLKKKSATHALPTGCFAKLSERDSMTLNKLTKVCELLNIPIQQRKIVRYTVSTQITQSHILRNTLLEILNELNAEMLHMGATTHTLRMGEQIVNSCLKLFMASAVSSNLESPSWMRPASNKKPDSARLTWGEPLEMIIDLTECLKNEPRLAPYVSKLEALKEGLYQIKDVMIDRDIGYRQAREQECLVRKNLSQSLGHSSECLFTLLLYYLYGTVNNMEIDLRGGIYGKEPQFCLCFGKVMTSSDDYMIWRGIKQLDRALGLCTFVWKVAGMKASLKVQGHIWVVDVEERVIEYRMNSYFVHRIEL
ncbi:hypothetical protein EJ110_NYTH30967 [Nymphaea thermarum]|nr:hypothetical protein EJ110_NYTH30967 [Nymphaea thermarum]